MMIQAVIFDMDGVLFDTERLGVGQQVQACRELGYPIDVSLVMRTMGSSMAAGKEIFLRELGADFPYDRMIGRWTELMLEYIEKNGVPKKSGVPEVLDALKARGIKTAVATSNNQEIVESYMRSAGLTGAFSAVVCGDRIQKSKPAPDIYLAAAAALNVPPSCCMGVEDSENGVRAVRAAGMVCVMVPDLLPFSPVLSPYVDHCAETLHGILPILS